MPTKGKRGSRKRSSPKKKVEEPPPEEEENDLIDSDGETSDGKSSDGETSDDETSASEEKGKAPEETPKKKSTKKSEAGKRFFKILADSIESKGSPAIDATALSSNGGRYTGNNPMQAAKKAFTRISRAGAPGGECTYVFKIQETTQGSAKKIFEYEGIREELEKPQPIKKGDTEYFIRFRSRVRSYKRNAPTKKAAPKKGAAKKKTSRRKMGIVPIEQTGK